jgi:hypothetical protein
MKEFVDAKMPLIFSYVLKIWKSEDHFAKELFFPFIIFAIIFHEKETKKCVRIFIF